MRIDRYAAAVVGDGQIAVVRELDLDARGVPGDRIVHADVKHLREDEMQGLLVDPPDIHAGAPAHRL